MMRRNYILNQKMCYKYYDKCNIYIYLQLACIKTKEYSILTPLRSSDAYNSP